MSTDPCIYLELLAECDRAGRIVEEAYPRDATPHSQEFKDGAKAILKSLLAGRVVLCPFFPATAEHDAFYAGVQAGKKIYQNLEDK